MAVSGPLLRCRLCERSETLGPRSSCRSCGGPLDVAYDPAGSQRYQSFLPYPPAAGDPLHATPLAAAPRLSELLGVELLLKLENANPTHSFKDRIAAVAVAAAQQFGFETVCCASTGNLAEAVAARCAAAGMEAVALCPRDDLPRVALSAFGARIFGVDGGFKECRALEQELESLFPWGFVGGNLHAIAAEGAKSIAFEIFEQLGGDLPDAVVAPAASGVLLAKLAQGFSELAAVELTSGDSARLYGAQAAGCPPLATAWADDRPLSRVHPATDVRSLAIGDPAYGDLALGAAYSTSGAIVAVSEEGVAAHSTLLAEQTGVLADGAAGVALGALVELLRTGAIMAGERVVLVVTGGRPAGAGTGTVPAEEVSLDVETVLTALRLA